MKKLRLASGMAAGFIALAISGKGFAGEPPCCGEPQADGFLQRLHPAGGWNPYGGGLLRWWRPDCFPCVGGPDDYRRKPLPNVCWPAYPSYYIWGPPQSCCSSRCVFPNCLEPR